MREDMPPNQALWRTGPSCRGCRRTHFESHAAVLTRSITSTAMLSTSTAMLSTAQSTMQACLWPCGYVCVFVASPGCPSKRLAIAVCSFEECYQQTWTLAPARTPSISDAESATKCNLSGAAPSRIAINVIAGCW